MAGGSKTNASEWFPGAAERDKRDRPAGLGGWGDRAAGTVGRIGGKERWAAETLGTLESECYHSIFIYMVQYLGTGLRYSKQV